MSLKLLSSDVNFNDVKSTCLEEAVNGVKKKRWYIEGIMAQADVKNRNRRIYPEHILFPQVDYYVENYVKQNRAVGQLGHPDSPTIEFDKVSHLITELTRNGSDVYGKARILSAMPYGRLTETLLEEGIKIGVSTRGMGSVDEGDDVETVKEDFFLAAIDVVHDPSAPKAFMNGIMEGKKFLIRESTEIKEFDNDRYIKEIRNAVQRNRDEIVLRLFNDFVSKL